MRARWPLLAWLMFPAALACSSADPGVDAGSAGLDATADARGDAEPRGVDAAVAPGVDAAAAADASPPGADASSGSDARAAGDATPLPITGDLFVNLPAAGVVRATLHPTDRAPLDAPTVVSFGVPFPRGVVASAGAIRVTDGTGAELPAHVAELARWRPLGPAAGGAESLRAALVQVSLRFGSRDPVVLDVHWGSAPAAAPPRIVDPWASWSPIAGSTFFPDAYPPADDVREPLVFATFPADWLGACILRTRTEPFGTDAGWAFFDGVAPQFARTGVNDVDARVTAGNRIDWVSAGEPWLFQRALTLFGMYIRSGDVAWLRHAHRAAQFYGAHLGADGTFDLAAGDLKYAYGSALFLDLMLTGDTRHLPRIAAVARAGAGWGETYTARTGFWTERHQTYALLAALVAWEATGEAGHATRARAIVAETARQAREPVSGWAPEGCVLHTQDAHEGDGVTDPICSPWMSALLAEAMFRAYVHSQDRETLEFLAGLADFVRTTGSASDGGGLSPYYLVSSRRRDEPDIEHACDVAGLVARGAWARRALGGDPAPLLATTRGLLTNCRANLESWHRPGGPAAGLAEWRLSPARKLNWWFGTTLDLPWLVDAP
jgi:hypothetical protein